MALRAQCWPTQGGQVAPKYVLVDIILVDIILADTLFMWRKRDYEDIPLAVI